MVLSSAQSTPVSRIAEGTFSSDDRVWDVPGRQWAECGGRHKNPDRQPRPRRRATYTRPHGVRDLFAAYGLGKDQLYGHGAAHAGHKVQAA